MTFAIIIAAIVAWATSPSDLESLKGGIEYVGPYMADRRIRVIAWTVVCVAMTAGIVAVEVLR